MVGIGRFRNGKRLGCFMEDVEKVSVYTGSPQFITVHLVTEVTTGTEKSVTDDRLSPL